MGEGRWQTGCYAEDILRPMGTSTWRNRVSLAEIRPMPEWEDIPSILQGETVLVLGAADTGKSTLVRWLAARLLREGGPVAWLDADLGQTTLGVPTTMNLAVMREIPEMLPRPSDTFFVGGTTPRGHMLPVLVGMQRLRERASAHRAAVTLIDTSGLVSPAAGGGALHEWTIELLRPQRVIALQRGRELEHLLGPLRRRADLALHELPVAGAVRSRSPEARAARRREQYRAYFATARSIMVPLHGLPVYGLSKAAPGRLLALLDPEGLSLALGILLDHDSGRMEILTPLSRLEEVAAIRLGDVRIEAETGNEFA